MFGKIVAALFSSRFFQKIVCMFLSKKLHLQSKQCAHAPFVDFSRGVGVFARCGEKPK
jgi:hypothetical protein